MITHLREIGLLRGDVSSEQDVEHCQKQLNQRPRKLLNYETPYEVFFEKPLHLVWQFVTKRKEELPTWKQIMSVIPLD